MLANRKHSTTVIVHLDQTSFDNLIIYSSHIKAKRVKSYTSHIKASVVYFSVYHKFIFIYRHNKKRTITLYKIKRGYSVLFDRFCCLLSLVLSGRCLQFIPRQLLYKYRYNALSGAVRSFFQRTKMREFCALG